MMRSLHPLLAVVTRGGCWAGLLLFAACGTAQTPPAAPPQVSDRVVSEPPRTIRVPLAELPRHIGGLVPIRRTDFNRLWPLYAPVDAAAEPPRAMLAAIDYRLSLNEAKTQLTGTVAYHIRVLDERPAAVEIEPAQFTWSNLQWKSAAEPGLRADQLVMGAAPDGRWRLLAPHSGALSCNITYGVAPDSPALAESPGVAVSLPAPLGAQARLTLELPDGWVTEPRPGLLWEPSALVDASAPAGKRLRRHQAVLTGRGAVAVGLPPGRGPRRATQYAVRESNHYSLLPGRIELETSLELDILRDQLDSLVLQLDPGLTVHRIRWGEQALAWSPTGSGDRRLSVALPEPLRGSSRLVQVSATATWGPAERLTLPRIRVPQAIWRQGRSTVATPPWLAADCLPTGCRLTLANLDPAGQEPDLRQFVFDEAGAKVELLRAPAEGALSIESGVVFTAAPNQLTAFLRADLRASGGECFETVCEFAAGWIVESVETQPLNQLESRVIRTQGERQSWLLRWKTPLGDEPLRLLVRARRPGANASAPLTDRDCFPFDFPQAWRHNRWLAVASSDRRQQFSLARAEGIAAAPLSALAAPEAERLAGAPSGSLVVNLQEISSQPLWLRHASEPAKIGQPRVDLFVTDGRLTTKWSVSYRARDESVERLRIALSPPPAEDLTWTLQRAPAASGDLAPSTLAGDVSARRLAPEELSIPNAAAWELKLQPSAAGDFSLHAESSQSWIGPVRAPLLIAHDRIGGVGQVNVSWSSASAPQLSLAGLTPMLTGESPGPENGAPWSYRYESEQAAGMTITPAGAGATVPLWCSEAICVSRLDRTGGQQTEVRLQLRGDFSRPLRIQPSAGSTITAARWSQGEPAAISGADALGWRGITLSDSRVAAADQPGAAAAEGAAQTLILSLDTPPRGGDWLSVFRRPEFVLACPLAVRREYVLLPGEHLFLPGADVRPATAAENGELAPLLSRLNEFQSGVVWAVGDARFAPRYGSWNFFRWLAVVGIFAVAYLALRLANRALGGVLFAAALLGLASPQLPAPLGLLAEAAAAGAFAGLLLFAWSPRRAAAPSRDANAPRRAAVRIAGVVLCCVWPAREALFGQPPPRPAPPPERLTIVDPINEQLTPAGDYLHVSPKLYESLYLRGQTLDAEQPACLIRAARYELRDLPRRENEPRPAPQLVVRLELQVREAARRIELPFRRDQLRLGAVEDSRTGQRLAGEWSPAGDFLWIEAAERGAVSLKLELWPIAAGNNALTIQIPRCPAAFAELTETGEWTFHASREAALPVPSPSSPAARALGAADSLRLYLPTSVEAAPLPEPEIELLTWWKLRENSAAAEVQVRTLRGRGEVRLRVDGALKPVGSGARLAPVGAADEQGRNSFVLTLGAPAPDNLSTEFILASAPTGLFAPPQVECLGAKVVRSRLLVSYAAELDCQGPASTWPLDQARAQTPELPTERLLAYELTSAAASPQFTVRGVQPRWSVDLEARWRLFTREARAEFRCQLSALGRQPSDLVIDLPPSLLVLDVQTAEAGVTTACRWRRQPSGRVAVLSPQGSSAEREVVLTCLLPRGGESCDLPAPRFPTSQAGNASFLIFRTPNLPVAVEPQAGWVNALAPPPEFIDPVWGRAAVALAPDPDLPPGAVVARCRWAESTPPLKGRQITLVRGGSGWTADLLCELDAGDQPLDALAWEIPAEWQGKLETSDASLRLVDQPSAALGKRVLCGQFAIPRSGKFSVRLTGKFPLADGSTIVTPSFRLLEHSQVRRLVALPIQAAGEALTWETTGLRAAERDEMPADPLLSGSQLWEVAEERQQASTSTERRDLPPLRIDWMDVELSSPIAGMWRMQVELGVVPGGRQSCQLALPGARLLAAASGGRAARVESLGAGSWEVELLSPHAPQRLELLWDFSEQPAESAFQTLALPEVLGGEVARTCIRLRHAPESGAAGISAAAIRPLALADHLQERLSALTAWRELDRAGEVVWIHPPAQRAWWSGLQAEIFQVEAALARQPAAAPPRPEQIWGADGPVERIVLHPAARESVAGVYYGWVILGLLVSGAIYWARGWLAAFAVDFYACHPRWCFLAAATSAWLLSAPLWLPLGLAAVGLLPHFARSTR